MSKDTLNYFCDKGHKDSKRPVGYHNTVKKVERDRRIWSRKSQDDVLMDGDDVLYEELASKRPEFRYQPNFDEVPFLQTLPFLEGRHVFGAETTFCSSTFKLPTCSRVAESSCKLPDQTSSLREIREPTGSKFRNTTIKCIPVTEKPESCHVRSRVSRSLPKEIVTCIKQEDSLSCTKETTHSKVSTRSILRPIRSPLSARRKPPKDINVSRTHEETIDSTGLRKKYRASLPAQILPGGFESPSIMSDKSVPETPKNLHKEERDSGGLPLGCPTRVCALRRSASSATNIKTSTSTTRLRNSIPLTIQSLLDCDSTSSKKPLIPGYDRAVEINMFELFNAGYIRRGDYWTFRRAIQDHLVELNIRLLSVNQDKSLKVEYLAETGETIPIDVPSLSQLQRRLLEFDGSIPREKWKNGATLNYFLVKRGGNPVGSLHQLRELAWRENCVVKEAGRESPSDLPLQH